MLFDFTLMTATSFIPVRGSNNGCGNIAITLTAAPGAWRLIIPDRIVTWFKASNSFAAFNMQLAAVTTWFPLTIAPPHILFGAAPGIVIAAYVVISNSNVNPYIGSKFKYMYRYR